MLVAYFIKLAVQPNKAVVWAPDGTPYDVSGNNFGHGKTTIVIPADCSHDDMLILYSTEQKFHCVDASAGYTMLCISNATNFPNIGNFLTLQLTHCSCPYNTVQEILAIIN